MTRRVEGTLTDAAGTPLAGWRLEFRAIQSTPATVALGSIYTATLSQSGGYDIELLDGRYLVILRPRSANIAYSELGLIEVTAGPDIDLLTLIGAPGIDQSDVQHLIDEALAYIAQAEDARDAAQLAETGAEGWSDLARDWATKTDGEVAPGAGYSAKHHAAAAAGSALAASGSASAASGSALAASGSAGMAAEKAGEAAAIATAFGDLESAISQAEGARDIANDAADAALGHLNDFRGRWYGPLASDPPVDPNGNPVEPGDAYWNISLKQVRVFNGTAWETPFTPTDSSLVAFQQIGTGAVARTVQDRAREVISVLDFIPVAEHAAIRAYTSTHDCTAGIQAAIDYAMYGGGRGKVTIPAGKYRTTDTIHLGYGNAFKSVVVEGDGYNYRASGGFNGTAIVVDFNDRPAINIQGARGTVLRGVTIVGNNFDWISANGLGSNSATLDDTNPANWVDTAFPSSADSRYAPYAGITIDAYSGSRPGVSYPDVSYPAFLGAIAQYGKSFSSDVLIEDCMITGFVAGIVIQPCDADGNADFTVLRRINLEKVKWGISIGNTQSRNVDIDNVKMGQFYCALVNNEHGRQMGRFNGTISNLSVGAGTQIFRFGTTAYAGPVTFLHLYAEALWRLGDITASSGNENSVIFQSCAFGFSNQTTARGIPANILGGGQRTVDIRFVGCQFTQFPSVIMFNQFGGTRLEGSLVTSTTRNTGTLSSEYLALAHNALCGGVVFPQFERLRGQRIMFKQVNLDTRAVGASVFCEEGYKGTSRATCIPIYPWEVQASSLEESGDSIRTPRQRFAQSKAGLASCTLSGRTLTFQFSSRQDWQFMLLGPDCGDVILDDETGMVFFVRSRTGTTVIAEAQNNYKDDGGGGFTTVIPFNPAAGNFYFANSRLYTPSYYLRGDVTIGSPTIANCARDDGFAAWYDAQIAVDDYLWVTASQDRVMGPGTALRVAARDQSAGTITMAGGFSRTEVRRRLSLFVRKPPANV